MNDSIRDRDSRKTALICERFDQATSDMEDIRAFMACDLIDSLPTDIIDLRMIYESIGNFLHCIQLLQEENDDLDYPVIDAPLAGGRK